MFRSLHIWCVLFGFLSFPLAIGAQSNDASDTIIVVNELQQYNRYIEYRGELYDLQENTRSLEHRFLFQPLFNKKDVITMEFGVVQSFLNTGDIVSPGDLNLTYRRNVSMEARKAIGYQGMALIVKNIIPTGRNEYFSGFDSWTVEPALGQQWTVGHPSIYIGYLVRYNYSYAALPGSTPRASFFRGELAVGYEDQRFWLFATPDFRYVPDDDRGTLFLSIEAGYKFNNTSGLLFQWKPRITGSDFYEQLLSAGIYKYL